MAETAPPRDPFGVPPEVTRFFDAKGQHPSGHWLETPIDEHAVSFTVARTAGYDVLQDLRDAVGSAIRSRTPFEDFRAGLEPLLKAKGWWGRKQEVDPETGEVTKVQLGSPRRLRTIYWANVRSANAAGEWERIQATKRVLPYLLYEISVALHKRELHLTWVGTCLLADDPWWLTHFPPNGWNCQCRVSQISEDEVIALGLDPANLPPAPEGPLVPFVNRKTGETIMVPVGIDPGWQTNPGLTRMQNASDMLAGRLDAASDRARRIATRDIAGSWLFAKIQAGEIPYDPADKTPANLSRGHIAVPVAALPDSVARKLGATTRVVRFSVADAEKQQRKRLRADQKTPSVTPEDYLKVQQLLDDGERIFQGERDLVAQMEIDGALWMVAIRRSATAPDDVFLKSFRRTEEDQAERRRRGNHQQE